MSKVISFRNLRKTFSIKDVHQLFLCSTWPRRPAGYNNITILHIKAIQERFSCAEL